MKCSGYNNPHTSSFIKRKGSSGPTKVCPANNETTTKLITI